MYSYLEEYETINTESEVDMEQEIENFQYETNKYMKLCDNLLLSNILHVYCKIL